MTDCTQNSDPLKLVREGTSQDERQPAALAPEYAPVDERTPAHRMVFAQEFAGLLKYFDETNNPSGNWRSFFDDDVAALMALLAIQDIDSYQAKLQEWLRFLNRVENSSQIDELKERMGCLFGGVGSVALALDKLVQALPDDVALKNDLRNLIRSQLAGALSRLIAYHKAGVALGLVGATTPDIRVLGQTAVDFAAMLGKGLSRDWIAHEGGIAVANVAATAYWSDYVTAIAPDDSVYGPQAAAFVRINHCATHALFKSVFAAFLGVFARAKSDAQAALEETLTKRNSHEPHYALFLAFLRLLEHVRESTNELTRRHLDFYYRAILGLKEKSAAPGQVHLLAELAKQAKSHEFAAGVLFKAGKDDQGRDAFFANERDVVANRAKVAALQTVYRHGNELVGGNSVHAGRVFASPIADSDDGAGAELVSADRSWHPFSNRIYANGALQEIRMPTAEIGWGIASRYLLLSGGKRKIIADIVVKGYDGPQAVDFTTDVTCHLTTEKGWMTVAPTIFKPSSSNKFTLELAICGDSPAIVPYSSKVHGGNFQTDLPLMLLKLKQDFAQPYRHPTFVGVVVKEIKFLFNVDGLKKFVASNDFGPLDTAKPFQPFGSNPVTGSSIVIGSKEVFQKSLSRLSFRVDWRSVPTVYPPLGASLPHLASDVLQAGAWSATSNTAVPVSDTTFTLTNDLDRSVQRQADFEEDEHYSTTARQGFVRLRLTGDFGQGQYQSDLIKYVRKDSGATEPPSTPPVGPTAAALSLSYEATAALSLNTTNEPAFNSRSGQFFHVTPFGAAEQHPCLNSGQDVFLFPQFRFQQDGETYDSEAELYVGISGLIPPQNLSLLFQVVDGTANPLVKKPTPHVAWSYMRDNEWVALAPQQIQDGTNGLLTAGIVTLSIPREATRDNTTLKGGLHWLRAAVAKSSDATCRLQLVAAQAMRAVFHDRGNSPDFSAALLPAGTISKLATPDSVVKSVTQPFPSFGGRGAERTDKFYTRISERLRHKNRAVDLWDYEHLILEAFPGIYKVKCLNHTWYEPNDDGSGIYRELAPGHVTIVTIPNMRQQKQRDPLKPYTSLGLLEQIRSFISRRTSRFATLHVANPQFEEVRVKFSLRLIDGNDETYYANVLRQTLTNFLSPWAVAGEGSPTFGGKVFKSVLVNFVEEQPYVDYVTDFHLFLDVGGVPGTKDLDVVEGSRAVSVLVSAPADKHVIDVIRPAQDATSFDSCACDS